MSWARLAAIIIVAMAATLETLTAALNWDRFRFEGIWEWPGWAYAIAAACFWTLFVHACRRS